MRKRGALAGLGAERLDAMLTAGREIETCYRVLRKTRDNVVSEILRGVPDFREWDHVPDGDVYDAESHAQYYYHAHPHTHGGDPRLEEHGHFHTFLRREGMPEDVRALAAADGDGDGVSHLIAISINRAGYPVALFTTNRWVTGETWYPAAAVHRMLPRFAIDHARPSWPVNRWLTAMLTLFGPDAEDLMLARDAAVAAWGGRRDAADVLEDRRLEITALARISVEQRLRDLRALRNQS